MSKLNIAKLIEEVKGYDYIEVKHDREDDYEEVYQDSVLDYLKSLQEEESRNELEVKKQYQADYIVYKLNHLPSKDTWYFVRFER